jgi:NADH-ubiquinone oxidoreductase chain 6
MVNYFLYEVFLGLIGLCGILVIVSRSPINSVLFLCGLYLAGGGIFLLLDHYFLGLTLIIVYVGAIAILFLFTIFMINVRLTLQLGSFASPVAAFFILVGSAIYFAFFSDISSSLAQVPLLSSIFGSIDQSTYQIPNLVGTGASLGSSFEVNSLLQNGAWDNSIRSAYASDWSNLLGRPSDLTMLANMIFHAYPLALILVGFLLLVVMVAIIRVTIDTH